MKGPDEADQPQQTFRIPPVRDVDDDEGIRIRIRQIETEFWRRFSEYCQRIPDSAESAEIIRQIEELKRQMLEIGITH
jgi:hypothetical protein